jgi:membrane-associated phospholipid phosphatase
MKKLCLLALALATLAPAVRADEVTDWNEMLFRSGIMTNPATSALVTTRAAAIFSAAVFDAINDGRYAPIHVTPAAPAGASRRAAAVEAAYTVITLLYPTLQYPSLQGAIDLRRQGALAVIAADPRETAQSIQDGKDWGKAVATAIVDWRKGDGFAPPCAPGPVTGGTAVGQWRPTPPGYLPGAGPQFACMTPWALTSPGQFAPPGPPALTSDRYTRDFNETKSMGNLTSPLRSADQTTYALFWASTTASYLWNRIAVSLLQGGGDDNHGSRSAGAHHSSRLLENARVLALLNIAMADAGIACWQAKYYQDAVRLPFWRPITAIPLADTDGNPATAADASWVSLITTPNHPEYPSGHSTVSASAATVLARFFGANAHFTVDSDLLLGVTRSFKGFGAALDEIKNARIVAGIHFRSACDDGQATGVKVANYVLANLLVSAGGDDGDDN